MSLFRIDNGKIVRIESTTFEANEMQERKDLQNMLKSKISVIVPDVLIVAEEFGEWEDSHRRIDLLGLDKEASLVVIELKRTDDGGHMELQALRYAAMISSLTFSRMTQIYEDYLRDDDSERDAQQDLTNFLDWDEVDEDLFAKHIKIVLVSANFSKELCTTVMWLNDSGLDIQCVRIAPYTHNGEVLLDVQTVIPLPEVADYQVRIREKKKAQEVKNSSKDYTKYNIAVSGDTYEGLNKRQMILRIVTGVINAGKSPEEINGVVPVKKSNLFESLDGELSSVQFVEQITAQESAQRASRYFTGDDELFHAAGRTYALTNQWGAATVKETIESLQSAFPEIVIQCEPAEQSG